MQKRKTMFKSQILFAKEYIKRFPPKRKDDAGGNDDNYNGILGTIKNYENPNWSGKPKLETVDNMCKILGCDVDYLLGTIDYETHNLKFICEYTGLSKEAVLSLHDRKENEDRIRQLHGNLFTFHTFDDLSEALTNEAFQRLISNLDSIRFLKNKSERAIDFLSNYKDNPELEEVDSDFWNAINDLAEYFPKLRTQLFEMSESWSGFLESFIPTKEIITVGKQLYRKYTLEDFIES